MLGLLLACIRHPGPDEGAESPFTDVGGSDDSAADTDTDTDTDTDADTDTDTSQLPFDDGSVCPELYGADDGRVPTWEGVCDTSRGFLLRDGRCYAMIEFTGYWADARASCVAAGGHLATMTSDEEAAALEDLGALLYLGACDTASEGTWQWITGEPWSWTDWRDGEPNNMGGDEDCLQGDAREPHWFNDIGCGSASPFGEDYLCEFEGVER